MVYCDNQATIKAFQQRDTTKRSKFIDLRLHYVKSQAAKEAIDLQYIPADRNPADLLTKTQMEQPLYNSDQNERENNSQERV